MSGLRGHRKAIALAVLLAGSGLAHAAGAGEGGTPGRVLLVLALILVAAKLGGDIAARLGQPAVLGELMAGVVLGNLSLFGVSYLEPLKFDPSIAWLAELGVLLLLFEVGLESTVGQMLRVGPSALLVALLGVIAPFLLGWGMGVWLLPEAHPTVPIFIGATLCATSVGITARVLQDLGRSRDPESRIILGAAVVDDVLGLIVLAAVTGLVAAADGGAPMGWIPVALLVAKSTLFLGGSMVLGLALSPRLFRLAALLKARGVLLGTALAICFFLSWLATTAGLAPIVGAFAAGLILEDLHFRKFTERGEKPLQEQIEPLAGFLAPVFFVLMGIHTDLAALANPTALGLALALTVAAVIGKQVCSLGVIGRGYDRLSIGIGMVPRGEVGLIFANIGLGLEVQGVPVIASATYTAIVAMVIITTLMTPPALKWSLARSARRRSTHPPTRTG